MVGEFVGTVLFLFFAFGKIWLRPYRGPDPAIDLTIHRRYQHCQHPSKSGASNDSTLKLLSVTLQINGQVSTSSLLFIALSFGFSLAVNAYAFLPESSPSTDALCRWVFFRISGGLFNPAVSLGLVVVGVLPPLRGALLTLSQVLGGITAAAIIHAILPGTLNVRTTLGGGASRTQGLFLEMFLTAMLLFTIFMLAVITLQMMLQLKV